MFYKTFVSPVLDRLDSETWHVRTREALHRLEGSPCGLKVIKFFADNHKRFQEDAMRVALGGVEFENPVVIGAGWDKVGRTVRGLWQLGAAGVEVGGVLEYPQDGNERPRQWIIAPGVCINRLGFNTPGMGAVARNLERYKEDNIPIGINIGENKWLQDVDSPELHAKAYASVARLLYSYAAWFTINVSSPNTPRLRRLQGREYLGYIAREVIKVMEECGGRKFLLVKIAPDIDNKAIDEVIGVAVEHGLGIVATNTTSNPEIKGRYGERWGTQAGGLSGDDYDFRILSTSIIAYIYRTTGGRVPLMGVGAIKDGPTAMEKILAGASVLQIVTALRGEGLSAPGKVVRELSVLRHKLGGNCSIQDLVGGGSRRSDLSGLNIEKLRKILVNG